MSVIVGGEGLVLEDQMSFIMYVCAKEMIKKYKTHLDEFDLTYTQYLAMLVLWNEDNILVSQLSEQLYLDSGTITPLLKKLEGKGLVERIKDKTDGRKVLVNVTPKGYEIKENVKKIPGKIIAGTDIPATEARHILNMLKSVLERVK